MAFTDLGSLGAIGNTGANQASLVLTTTAAVAVGELVVITVGVDNNASGGDDLAVASVTNSGTANTWTKAVQIANALAAQAGASCSIWYTVATSAMASGATITATFTSAANSDASAMTARHFSMAAGMTAVIEGTPATLVNNTGADPGSLDVTTSNIACLRIRGIASQVGNNTNLTPTASWTAWANGNSATSGTTAEICARAEHRIVTGTSAPSDPTYVSAIYASAHVAFKEIATVTINAIGTNSFANSTSISNTGLTIAAGSDRALIVVLSFAQTGGTLPTGISCSWGGVAMTQLYNTYASAIGGGTASATVIFGLVNPATGNQTIAASWTSSHTCYVCGIAFNGVNQGGGQKSFPNGAINSSGGTPNPNVSVNCPASGYVVGVLSSIQDPTMAPVQLFKNASGAVQYGGGNYKTSGAGGAVTLSAATGSNGNWSYSAVGIAPVAAPLYWIDDDFSRYADATVLNGQIPQIGPAWATSGAATPTTSGGFVICNPADVNGYLFNNIQATAPLLGARISFTGIADATVKTMTLAYAANSNPLAFDDLLHLNFGPQGFTFTKRIATGSFVPILVDNWTTPIGATPVDVTLSVNGSTATVTGPSGEIFSITDADIPALVGQTSFWEPVRYTGGSVSRLSRAWALRDLPVSPGSVGAAAGVGTASAGSNKIVALVGAASGIGTASAGSSVIATISATGNAAGIGGASAQGRAVIPAAGAAAGIGAANAAAIAGNAAVGNATGTGNALGVPGVRGIAAGSGVATATATAVLLTTGEATGTGSAQATATAGTGSIGAAAGTGTATSTFATGINRSAGAASGIGTTAAVSATAVASIGAASGNGTSNAAGRSTAAAIGNAAGTSMATGLAESGVGIGAAAGIGTASSTGRAITNGTGAAAGLGAASAASLATIARAGTAAGTGATAAIGRATAAGTGSATATGTASAIGQGLSGNVGSATGIGTAHAVGQVATTYAGTAAGTGTANAAGRAIILAAGTATTGIGVAAAVGRSVHAAIGQASGAGIALGRVDNRGEAAGFGTAAAFSTSLARGVGNAAGIGTAAAYSTAETINQIKNLVARQAAPPGFIAQQSAAGRVDLIARA